MTNFLNNKKNYSNKSIFNNVNKLMLNSVKQKKIADVPIAIALSGGIDSSAILGIFKKIKY